MTCRSIYCFTDLSICYHKELSVFFSGHESVRFYLECSFLEVICICLIKIGLAVAEIEMFFIFFDNSFLEVSYFRLKLSTIVYSTSEISSTFPFFFTLTYVRCP